METDETPLRKTKSVLLKALCDILRPVINNLVVLELFAGSGRVGKALLSEGARRILAVDVRPPPPDPAGDIDWYKQKVEAFLKYGPPEPVGLVFMDPPYDTDYPERMLEKLAEVNWLKKNAIVAVETRSERPQLKPVINDELYLIRCRRYGGSMLWIYQSDREKPVADELED